ncbi:amidohydrolase family protein [Pleionea sp. CnH1-48]|uniref:amidohydrolase family protein n=1 Tax=Pleionea sp. CnH1-48 TaxID=2954494 RepID=UPI002096C705|nr:amidohydrolase family protein [Pleionea sp. CnH1-48]MCO7222676.1 amidohydrolase family protein [Pleionea sp. CnH1-48]
MRIFILIVVLISSIFISKAQAKLIATDDVIIFKNINVVDVNKGSIQQGNYLIIQSGMIEYVGADLPEKYSAANTVDAQGEFVVPGFIDTHAHISLGEVSFKKKQGKLFLSANSSDEVSLWNARELLRWGVTFIRNPGGSSEYNLRYKNGVKEGSIVGPGAKVAGEILNQGAFDGLVIDINNKMPLKKAIEQQHAAGIDIIKLYSGLTEQQVRDGIKLGHDLGMTVIAHLEDISWTDAASWNIDGLVHAMPISPSLLRADARDEFEKNSRPGSFAHFEWYEKVDLDSESMRELYQTLREKEVYVDPTLIVFKNSFYGNSLDVTSHPDLNRVHPELLNNWRTFFNFNLGWKEDDFNRAQKVWPKVLGFVYRLYKEGVPLTIGSDLGNPWVIPGLSVHQEMKLFSDAGIPNSEILKMATINAAKQLGISDSQGTIERGKVASMVFLKKNPLEDISNTQSISKVYRAGKKVYEIEPK